MTAVERAARDAAVESLARVFELFVGSVLPTHAAEASHHAGLLRLAIGDAVDALLEAAAVAREEATGA